MLPTDMDKFKVCALASKYIFRVSRSKNVMEDSWLREN